MSWFLIRYLVLASLTLTVCSSQSGGWAAAESGNPVSEHRFHRTQLCAEYYSEGTNVGDLNGDGAVDIVYGPFWFAGPDFKQRFEIYPAVPQPREGYADHFFCWVYDFDRDQHNDILVVGFPGTPAYVYRNPGAGVGNWTKHQVLDSVGNESPQWMQLIGDERPELVCAHDGFFGYAEIPTDQPLSAWQFHAVSDQITDKRFGHGLGIGDVNGDDRLDLIHREGWLEQPAELGKQPRWRNHPVPFAPASADMYAYDVDGDGDHDIITSLHAHEYGLAWYENTGTNSQGDCTFQKRLIMGERPEENEFGIVFTELHTVRLADIDGDGLQDIVTGKTYWSHHRQSPLWDAGAVVYWFQLKRSDHGQVQWIPHLADGQSGVGRQVIVSDVNADRRPDIVVGGMLGSHVLRHETASPEGSLAQTGPEIKELANGLAPADAARHMTTLPGFHVQLAAGEPQVHQPVAMTLDERGRLWIAEAHTYPNRAAEGAGQDKIIILEDQDHDGSWETRKVFAEGLNLVSGLELGHGGVWVGAAPYLLFLPDANQDDFPDAPPQILLDGFGYHDTHETLNSFIWGPDGWLYGCHGVFTHSKVGAPGTPDAERVPINAGVWRYHPLRKSFEVFAWGSSNPWGLDFNDQGQAFITACVIPHLYHVIQGAHYQRQAGQDFNPFVYDDIKTIADHLHYAGKIQDHAWWGSEPQAPVDTLAAGGGHAHCGAMVYLGDQFPQSYRNHIFMHNVHGNRVNQDVLARAGSGYIGHHGQDLLLANDRWFRGISLRTGPDGSVFLIDWYDRNACHRTNPLIWDRTNGRVYNIRYGESKSEPVDLGKCSDEELAAYQLHSNDWYVRMARRLLQERSGRGQISAAAVASLRGTLQEHVDPTRVLRAMWALHGMGQLSPEDLDRAVRHANEYVRAWSIQLLTEMNQVTAKRIADWQDLATHDPSPVVRLYLASMLQHIPPDRRWDLCHALFQHGEDAKDHNLPCMLWYAMEPLVTLDATRALQLSQSGQIPMVRQFLVRRAATDDRHLPQVIDSLQTTTDVAWQELLLEEMLRAFEGRVDIPLPANWEAAYQRLVQHSDPSIRDLAEDVAALLGSPSAMPRLRSRVMDRSASVEKRKHALQMLTRAEDKALAEILPQLVQDSDMRQAAILGLAQWENLATMQMLIDDYATLSSQEKQDLINTLCGRRPYAKQLLGAISEKKIPRQDVGAYHVRQVLALKDDTLRAALTEIWGQIRNPSAEREAQMNEWKSRLSSEQLSHADPSNGRRVFEKTCASCHRLFGEGGDIGPDLTGSNRANLDYVLQNVLDPSAVLGNDYRLTILELEDGRVVAGILRKETDSAVTLRTINDTVVVPKREIEHRQLSELSMMPEQLLEKLTPDEVRDLVGYLASPQQVPKE